MLLYKTVWGQGWQLRRAGACMMSQGQTRVSWIEEGGSSRKRAKSTPGAPLGAVSDSPRLDVGYMAKMAEVTRRWE